jgi:hypothetical protein
MTDIIPSMRPTAERDAAAPDVGGVGRAEGEHPTAVDPVRPLARRHVTDIRFLRVEAWALVPGRQRRGAIQRRLDDDHYGPRGRVSARRAHRRSSTGRTPP